VTTQRGGGGGGVARVGGSGGGNAHREIEGQRGDDCGAWGCDYDGGRGVSTLNGPGFDCSELHRELG
jgi:hypothetical protein